MESPRKAITDKEINIKLYWPIFLMLIDVKFIMYQSIPKPIILPQGIPWAFDRSFAPYSGEFDSK